MHKYTTELRILLQIVRIQIWLKYFSKSDPDSTYQNLTTCKQKKLHFFFKHIKNLIFKIKHKQHVMSFEVFLHQCLNNFLMLLCKLRVESARLVYPSFILMVCLSSLNADCNLMNWPNQPCTQQVSDPDPRLNVWNPDPRQNFWNPDQAKLFGFFRTAVSIVIGSFLSSIHTNSSQALWVCSTSTFRWLFPFLWLTLSSVFLTL